jgi:hypothetical protein
MTVSGNEADCGPFTSPCKGEVGREASGRGSAAVRFGTPFQGKGVRSLPDFEGPIE